jgi:hypothetical protein
LRSLPPCIQRFLSGLLLASSLSGCATSSGRSEPVPSVTVLTTTTVAEPVVPNTIRIATTTTSEPFDLGKIAAYIDESRERYGTCGEWHDLAISVGWTEDEWSILSRILYRESRCTPDAWNGHDAGLTQINQVHSEWIESLGWVHPESMFDPATNLRFAKMLKDSSGWSPWAWLELP